MRNTRPTAVLVIAILHFVGGGLSIAGDTCGLAFQGISASGMLGGPQGANQADTQKRLEKVLEEKIPAYKVTQIGQIAFDLILSILMIIGGIGLVKMAPWGRNVSIGYAVLSLLFRIVITVYIFAVIAPAMRVAIAEAFGQDKQFAAMAPMMEGIMTAAYILPLAYAIYPIVVLVFMFNPSIAAAFRAKPSAMSLEDESDIDEPDEQWGRPLGDKPDERIQPGDH